MINPLFKKFNKIAVLRANAMGDFIFSLPAIQTLRDAFPNAEIVFLGKKWHEVFLKDRPSPVDRVVVIPDYPGVGAVEDFQIDELECADFFSKMRDEQFDLAIQMHGGGKNSNPFLLKLGAKYTLGLQSAEAMTLDKNIPYVLLHSEILRYLEVVTSLGIPCANLEPELKVMDRDHIEAASLLARFEGEPFVIIHPGATDYHRRWPEEKFSAIVNYLTQNGFMVGLTGTGDEKGIIENVRKGITHPDLTVNLCDKMSFSGLVGILSKASLLISNDTGPLHLARALKTPTVGIIWAINCLMSLPTTSSIHRNVIEWNPICPFCGKDCTKARSHDGTCEHEISLVRNIPVEEVKEVVDELLQLRTIQLSSH